jgi:hypothetical protein
MQREGAPPAWHPLFLGACVTLGLATGGYLIGRGIARFKWDTRTVTVKGLVEKDVDADEAVWTLELKRASSELADAHARIGADREAVLAFLRKHGFKDDEIGRQPTLTVDKLARDFGQDKEGDRLRYVVTTALVVKTSNVERVRSALGSTDELLGSGVVLDGERDGRANPRYIVSRFNDLRPQLLAAATKNARTIAEQFASDSGVTVGRIRSANQGTIQIFGSDGNDESGPYSPTSTPVKKIRVVSTFEFDLE